MALNRKIANADHLTVAASHPTLPQSGQPMRFGTFCGVAMIDERSDGLVTMDISQTVYELSVKGVDAGGNAVVAAGDALYYIDADVNDGTGFLSKKVAAGVFFGWALEGVGSGLTANIDVLLGRPGDPRIV